MTVSTHTRGILRAAVIGLGLLAAAAAQADRGKAPVPAAYQALLQQSLEEKVGLVFYVKGQTVAGIVTTIGTDGTVEVRNQVHDRIVIRLDRVDALAR